ncbi:MAG: hypothetical protein IJU83_01065 [Clostridia bacterium]|nr:hypothetical protein [Clostridia bacterium]
MNGFEKVSYKPKEFKVNFTDKSVKTVSLAFKPAGINCAATPVRVYRAGDDLYAFFADGGLKKAVCGEFVPAGYNGATIPLVISALISGERKTLIIGENGATAGEEMFGNVPYGTTCTFFGGRLFTANGRRINYTTEFDYADFGVGRNYGGFIETPEEGGDVIFLASVKNALYAVCVHAVYEITAYGDQFEFKTRKTPSFYLDARKNSAAVSGDKICFISQNAPCVLSDGKIKRRAVIGGINIIASGYAGAVGSLYLFAFSAGNAEYVYAYDTVSGEETLAAADGYEFVDGYAFKDGNLYTVALCGEYTAGLNVVSEKYDFGTCRKKAVCHVETHIKGSAELLVEGEGFFRTTLTESCNSATCFVHGREFRIAFENRSADFKAYGMTVRYVVYGN